MPLERDQLDFTQSLLNPDADIPAGILGSEDISAQQRFAVYRNNVVSSLISALKTAFPAVSRIVGDEFFEAMAAVFVRTHPPSSPLMMFYGEAFPAFLESFEPVAELPYLSEVARLEQVRRQIYHAADASALPADFLSTIPEDKLPGLVFDLHPASDVLAFDYPVFSIWALTMQNADQPQSDLPPHGEDGVVWREGDQVLMRTLSPGGASFLADLGQGKTFAESAEGASGILDFDLADTLAALIESQIVIAVK
ncbi:MAG: DNA-binding domain-containing protein [Sneathiella sp.]